LIVFSPRGALEASFTKKSRIALGYAWRFS
jgi:hypothetical protein